MYRLVHAEGANVYRCSSSSDALGTGNPHHPPFDPLPVLPGSCESALTTFPGAGASASCCCRAQGLVGETLGHAKCPAELKAQPSSGP